MQDIQGPKIRTDELEQPIYLERNKEISTMVKCGFSNTINKNIMDIMKDILKSKFYSLIFYLRIIKKIMYKNL